MGDEAESNLEMRCSADEAWYDGTLRVSEESKELIVVHFNDFDDEEDETFHRSELRDPAKLRSRVRVRSVQLQDSQCRRVYESQKICGCLDDGEDRKYYDCEVTAIAKRLHAFKNDGEECLCKFTVFWLDGPKKREMTVIGCAEVCFLSLENPEEDPMVKNLLNSLAGHGEQPRRKLVKSAPKTVPKSDPPKSVAPPKPVLPRPRTPSPSLELAPSKKQPSREPSPPVEAPTQTVPELARTKSVPIGSKKKRIMQAAVQVANDNDKVGTTPPKDHNSRLSAAEGDEDAATGHGDESVAPERRVQRGALQAREKKRIVKGKAKAAAPPEVINHHEVPREEDDTTPPTGPVKKRLKLPTKSQTRTVTSETVTVTQSLAERVKLKKAQRNPDAGATPEAAAPPAAASPPATATAKQQDNIVQSLGERVKLKTAQKNPSAGTSPVVDAHKDSLQRIGKQVVRKQVTRRELIRLEDPAPDPLRSKFDKVVKPRTLPSKPKVSAPAPPEPPKAAPEPPTPSPSTAEPEPQQPKALKRKAGRPRKRPLLDAPKNQTSSEQNQSPHEEETLTSNPRSKRNASKKRPREEEEEQPEEKPRDEEQPEEQPRDEEEQPEEQPRDEEEQPEEQPHDEEEQPRDEEEQPEEQPRDEEEQPEEQPRDEEEQQPRDEELEQSHHDKISETAPRNTGKQNTLLVIGDLNQEAQPDHTDTSAEQEAEAANNAAYTDNKVSIAEKFRDIQNKYHNNGDSQNKYHNNGDSSLSTPQAAQELISLAGLKETEDDVDSDATEDDDHERQRRSSRIGKRQLVIADDEGEGEDAPSRRKPDDWSAVDEEGKLRRGRVLVLENMEADASAYDAMQVLMGYTEGVCAVHVLPVLEFCVTATGYALYRDWESAGKALRWLTSLTRFVVSPKGRPWIVSHAKDVYGPRLCGFAAHTAYKSDDFGMCGLISDQPHVHDLMVVTKQDNSAYYKAQQMSKAYEEQKKWRKDLYDRIVQQDKRD